MRDLLAPYGVEAVSAGALNLAVPAETGHMFSENAALKAHAAAKRPGCPRSPTIQVLRRGARRRAGPVLRRLGGRRRFCARDGADRARAGAPRARRPGGAARPLVSALVIAWPDGHEELFEGRVHGVMVWPPRATRAFGTTRCSSRGFCANLRRDVGAGQARRDLGGRPRENASVASRLGRFSPLRRRACGKQAPASAPDAL
jgi:hypothetical protein